MKTGVCTDAGKIRELNQDDYAIYENDCCLYIVADGMGGHQCGEIASRMAVEMICQHVKNFMSPDMNVTSAKGILSEAFNRANKRIIEYSHIDPACAGMGTTLTLLYYCERHTVIGHIGDSRAYLLRKGKLKQLSKDHSLVAELHRSGEISEEEAQNHPQKHVITRALGMGDKVKADLFQVELFEEDRVLLCSDGLTNLVNDEEILEVITKTKPEHILANELVMLANDRGGHDNITVLLVNIQGAWKESR